MDLEIRTARADDVGPIAELMYSSGSDLYDYLYRTDTLDFLRHEFASGKGFAGYPQVPWQYSKGRWWVPDAFTIASTTITCCRAPSKI